MGLQLLLRQGRKEKLRLLTLVINYNFLIRANLFHALPEYIFLISKIKYDTNWILKECRLDEMLTLCCGKCRA